MLVVCGRISITDLSPPFLPIILTSVIIFPSPHTFTILPHRNIFSAYFMFNLLFESVLKCVYAEGVHVICMILSMSKYVYNSFLDRMSQPLSACMYNWIFPMIGIYYFKEAPTYLYTSRFSSRFTGRFPPVLVSLMVFILEKCVNTSIQSIGNICNNLLLSMFARCSKICN